MINVGKVTTISLQEEKNRQKQAEIELAKLQLQTDFFLAERDKENGERGCFNSHLQVCQKALRENHPFILVFEDDIRIRLFQQKQIDAINQFLKKKKDFDILYLGLIISKMWFCGFKRIVRAKGAGAHAYILSRQGMEKLSTYSFNGTPIDKIFKRDFKCYSVYPIIAEQHPETVLKSAISPFRSGEEIKDKRFWKDNYRKQKKILWKNLYRSLAGFITF